MTQDRQTVGIPIGPDTSLVIAEIIMQRCDAALLAKIPGVRGHRFIDDYELSFATRTDAENAFHALETCLADFELALNPKKTFVRELPLVLEGPWVVDLRRFTFRSSALGQAADLSDYFSKAYELYSEHPDEPVLQFAVGRLRGLTILPSNWQLFQRLLLLCAAPEPATLPYVLQQIILRRNIGMAAPIPELTEVINALIKHHAPLRHSSEVANSLWSALALDLKIDSDSVDAVSQCDDAVVALLALDCEAQGRTLKPLDKTLWSTHMAPTSLYDEFWLLAYEANVKGWLPNPPSGDFVAADPNFGFLKQQGVYFYDLSKSAPAPTVPIPMPTVPTVTVAPGSPYSA